MFDASSKDSKGLSLNDALYKGPVIQSDLFTIVMRFRCLKYVICADIKKMYRQIKVYDDHRCKQYFGGKILMHRCKCTNCRQ